MDLIAVDIEAAKAYYSQLMQWTWRQSAPESGYWLAERGGCTVAGALEVPGQAAARWVGYTLVDDAAATLDRVRAAGG